MSNVISNKKESLSAAEMRPSLVSAIKAVLSLLEADTIPPSDSYTELQGIFRQYMESLSEKQLNTVISKQGIQISFTDIPADEVKSNDIIADLLQCPDVIEALFIIGSRKLVKAEELPLSDDQKDWLTGKGYIAPLEIDNGSEKELYTVLTSKGWLCFQRDFITQHLRKKLGYTTLLLPEWLAAPQNKWGSCTYERAIVLRSFFIKTLHSSDFMVFSFPESTDLLFGCSAREGIDNIYACAVLENTALTQEEQKTLLKVISANEITGVQLICSSESYGKKICKQLKLSSSLSKKTGLIVLEETDG